MYTAKEQSTNLANKEEMMQHCPVTYTLEKIGGRWKALILYHLTTGSKRYGELRKAMPGVTEKMLIQQLREMELDKLVLRDVKPVVPPHVTYTLTDAGAALAPVMREMAKWGMTFQHNAEFNKATCP